MRYRYKIIYSRLLVLIMVISSFQSAVAIDFSQNMHGEESQVIQMLLSDVNDMGVGSDYQMDHIGENTSHTDCAAQCYVTFLQDTHATLLVTRSKIKQKLVADTSAFSSHFPSLLKRPPKI